LLTLCGLISCAGPTISDPGESLVTEDELPEPSFVAYDLGNCKGAIDTSTGDIHSVGHCIPKDSPAIAVVEGVNDTPFVRRLIGDKVHFERDYLSCPIIGDELMNLTTREQETVTAIVKDNNGFIVGFLTDKSNSAPGDSGMAVVPYGSVNKLAGVLQGKIIPGDSKNFFICSPYNEPLKVQREN
jgi:hypothetical protein